MSKRRRHKAPRADRQFLTAAGILPNALSLSGSAVVDLAAAEGDGNKRPTFAIDAYGGGILRLAGWYLPVVVDLAGLRAGKATTVLMDHDPSQIVGQGRATINAEGVKVAGQITGDTDDKAEAAGKVVMHARHGFAWAASIGASVERTETVKAGVKVAVNGKGFAGPLVVVRAGRLGEVSFVSVGADESASAKVAASAAGGTDMKFSEWLQAKGFDESALDDKATASLRAMYDAENKPAAPAPVAAAPVEASQSGDLEVKAAEARAEQKRKQEITALFDEAMKADGADVDALQAMGRKAIEGGATAQSVELQLLHRSRPPAGFAGRRAEGRRDPQVLAAAMLLHLGVSDEVLAKDRDFGEKAVEAAYPHRSITLHGLIAAALEADGIHAPHSGDELFRAAVDHSVKAGFSTVDLGGLLGTVGNKLLLSAFTAVDATYERIAMLSDFSNFLTYTTYRLDQTGAFAQVGRDGELKHGQLGETKYTNKLETSGLMLTLTRQQIINDDTGALNELYGTLGKSARIAVEEALYNEIMESADSFYTAARLNLNATTALSVAGIGVAEASLLGMLDENSKPIYATPKILLVPPALKFRGKQLIDSQLVLEAATAAAPQGSANPYYKALQVESSPFLSLAAMDGYSATTWYLLADPNVLPAFQVAFLSGKRQPTIESADAEFSTLGMQMRCFFDFGVAQIDYRGATKQTA